MEFQTGFVENVWPRSTVFIDGVVRRQTELAQRITLCKVNGVACCVFSAMDRSCVLVEINGPVLPKLHCKDTVGKCVCQHAEQKVIAHLKEKDSAVRDRWLPVILATNSNCCLDCAKTMVQCGFVTSFVYRVYHAKNKGVQYLLSNGISVYRLPLE